MHDTTHRDRVLNLAARITANPTRIDLSRLVRILRIDVVSRRCVAEAGVTFRALARALLPLGLAPPVIRERDAMTIGGAVDHMPSAFHESCVAYEVVTPFGDVVRYARNVDRARFDAMRASFGKLGVITEIEFDLVTVVETSRTCRTNESFPR